MSFNREDHEKLEKLVAKIINPQLHATVGERAVVGAITHLVVLAATGRKSELKSWLHDSATFTAWLSTMSASQAR